MKEFTKEEIAKARAAAVFLGEPGCEVFREALDEIERLQNWRDELEDENHELKARVQELETQLKSKEIERGVERN